MPGPEKGTRVEGDKVKTRSNAASEHNHDRVFLMAKAGLTNKEIARAVSVRVETVCRILKGRTKMPFDREVEPLFMGHCLYCKGRVEAMTEREWRLKVRGNCPFCKAKGW